MFFILEGMGEVRIGPDTHPVRPGDFAEYPDSAKFGVLASFGPDAAGHPQEFRFVGREGRQVPYWEGE